MKRMRELNDTPHCLGSKSYAKFTHGEVYMCKPTYARHIDVNIYISKCLLKQVLMFFLLLFWISTGKHV
jgi:hypothetical protein